MRILIITEDELTTAGQRKPIGELQLEDVAGTPSDENPYYLTRRAELVLAVRTDSFKVLKNRNGESGQYSHDSDLLGYTILEVVRQIENARELPLQGGRADANSSS